MATRSQRRPTGGFTVSARAIALYCRIRKHCHTQRSKRFGLSCEVSVATLAAAAGVQPRQVRNLRRQLVDQGMILVELEKGVHGTNVYHLVLPIPAAAEQLLPGKPARTPGPHLYVATPGKRRPSPPRQEIATALYVGVEVDLGVEVSLDPTPERQKGAGASGPALSGADTPPAPPVPPPSGRAGKATPDAAGGVTTENPTAGSLRRSAKTAPEKPRDVVEIWPKEWSAQREILERFLRVEFPSITSDVVNKTLDATRAAKLDEVTGGPKVRSAWRYAAKVAARILSTSRPQAPQPPPSIRRTPEPPEAPRVDWAPGAGEQLDVCTHGVVLDEDCPKCDHNAPMCWLRAARRQQVRPGRGTEIANKLRVAKSSSGGDDVNGSALGARCSAIVINESEAPEPAGVPTPVRSLQLRSAPRGVPE